MERVATAITHCFMRLVNGRPGSFESLFAGEPRINTPLHGEIRGRRAFAGFIDEQRRLLSEEKARAELFAITATGERIVAEFLLTLHRGGTPVVIPIAVAADRTADAVSMIRVYYSSWPLRGRHRIRPPIIVPAADLVEPAIVRAYTAALKRGDTEAVLTLFEEDGYAREPSGAGFRHEGVEGLRAFYSEILADGGISLTHCTATFDGTRCAVEYTCDRWGTEALPPQAGMAVYELSGNGRLAAARIYDDISPPGERG
ncbi:hypothetical protein ABH15_05315 [Methanoculleus taiwanensis]|uniref:SnoaL-like domain-containing protein n=1 Tax=Methanoculleus taiwanensis TaxID=1550565 RepID=A0A498GYM5_9EURY|nr:nuclear transport factor 2 family protein [Methanoculleus taiwanensis]RXE55662.1 hypothetical protein ABH15_05315 [Methanoculleus taiwanensis]